MKKLISAILFLCMAISLMPLNIVFASENILERRAELTFKVGITTPAFTETNGKKTVYNLEPGTSYYVAPRGHISSSVAYGGPVNSANMNVYGYVETYSSNGEILNTSDDELLSAIIFEPNTYKLIRPIENRKQLFTEDVVAYHYGLYQNLRLPGFTSVAIQVSDEANIVFPHASAFYRIFDKDNNFIYESFASGELKLNAGEILYIRNPIFRTMNFPIYTDGSVTIIEHDYYEDCMSSYKSFEIEGDDDIPLGTTAKYSAIYPNEDKPVNRELIWSVSDPSIAKVTSDGTVTPISVGETELMARYTYSHDFVEKKEIIVRNPELKDVAFNFRNYEVPAFNDDIMHAIYENEKKWTEKLINMGNTGMCGGMCDTSLLINQGFLNVKDYGGDKICEIEEISNNLDYRMAFHQAIQSEFSAKIEFGTGTIKYNKSKNKNKFSEIVEKTRYFYETGQNPIVLFMRNNTGGYGHSVIPYYVDDTDPSCTKIHFYDPNVTYSGYANPLSGGYRYLKLTKQNGTYTGDWEIRAVTGQKDEPRYPKDATNTIIFDTKHNEKTYLSYYPYNAIITTMNKSALYKNNDPDQMELFSTEEMEEPSYINLIRTLKDVTISNSSGGSAVISDYSMASDIDGIDYLNEFDESPSSYHRLALPYDTYTVKGESDVDVELLLANDYLITTINTKDNSAVTFNYTDCNANPEIEIVSENDDDTFSLEHQYFDTNLKYDNLLFEGTQKGKLSIVPEETGFAVTGATKLTFTATVSETPTTITLDEIAEGETIHIVLDGRDISITDSASVELGTGRLTSRSSTANPVALLPEGEYSEAQTLEFETDEDTVIYYTTDGSTPDEESNIYFGPITIDRTMRIKAKAKKYGYKLSSTVTLDYTLPEVSAPVADISDGYYLNTQKVRLTTETEGAQIYYTTDGSDPRYNGMLYAFPIDIDKSCTLRTCAKLNTCASETANFEYVLDIDGAYLTSTQVVDGVVTATVEQASGKEVTLIAVRYDASGKTEAIKIHKETIPEGENLISFNSGLTGENIAVYVWEGVIPIPVK